MKLTCYGTAAAEAIPALYCSCPLCEKARELGGREIRSRHSSTVDKDIQFDLSPDFFYQIQCLGLEPRSINHLIITHTHGDHFDMDTLNKRISPFSLVLDHELEVIGSQKTIDVVKESMAEDLDQQGLRLTVIKPYETLSLDAQTKLTALPANHAPGLEAMIYLLERNGKKLLYAHDTGPLFEEVLSFLAGKQIDAATLDCTGSYHGAGPHHMQLSSCEEAVAMLRANGALQKDALIMINHHSHGGGALYQQLAKEAEDRHWVAAYDGLEISI